MPSTLQNLQETPDNYLILSSIGFNKASMSTLMVGTQQVESGVNYMTCKAKIKDKLIWFDCDKHF
jgi:hypothetical protein